MINFNDVIKEERKEYNSNWPEFPDYPYRIWSWRLWIWKNKLLFNLISPPSDIDKTYLYAKDLHKQKYQFSIDNRESTGSNHCTGYRQDSTSYRQVQVSLNDSKGFIEYSNNMDNIYEEYNPNKKRKILIVFDNIIVDMQ